MRSVATLAILVVAAVLALSSGSVCAGEPAWLPKPPRGQGEKCVADTDWMRRNHMTVLLHQRDNTVHDGIRTKRFSLKGCIECHAVKGADAKPVTVASPTHFCRSCHDYAAVRVDCFECHASRPEAKASTTGNAAPERSDAAMLAQYLRSVGQ
jgi:predicted CXXCH cytochrome family protein